jgi:hypothetical protein
MSGWQPIETAPKDGTRILAYWPDIYGHSNSCQVETWFGPRGVGYEDDLCWQSPFEWGGWGSDPTHWMPLPPPPVTP